MKPTFELILILQKSMCLKQGHLINYIDVDWKEDWTLGYSEVMFKGTIIVFMLWSVQMGHFGRIPSVVLLQHPWPIFS